MLSNDILKYLKTMERKHPKHRARYSHTAWLHSTVPDPIQSNMISVECGEKQDKILLARLAGTYKNLRRLKAHENDQM